MADDNNLEDPIEIKLFAATSRDGPIVVKQEQAKLITLRWMSQICAVREEIEAGRSHQIIIDFSGRNYTKKGAAEIIRFLKLEIVGPHVIAYEFGGTVGKASNAQLEGLEVLVLNVAIICINSFAVNLKENVNDDCIDELLPLFTNALRLQRIYMHDCDLNYQSLMKVHDALSTVITPPNGTTFRRCEVITQFIIARNRGCKNSASAFAEVIKISPNINNLEYMNGENATEAGGLKIAMALSTFVGSETLRRVNLQGCRLNGNAVDLLLGTLATLPHLEVLNLQNCGLSQSQNLKLKHRLLGKGRLEEEDLLLSFDDSIPDDPVEFDMSQQLVPRVRSMQLR